MDVSVREVQATIRMNLVDAPKVRLNGCVRKPYGLRITYGRTAGIDRVDLVIEWGREAQLWPPSEPLPGWLTDLIRDHEPEDVSAPSPDRRTGMGGLDFSQHRP